MQLFVRDCHAHKTNRDYSILSRRHNTNVLDDDDDDDDECAGFVQLCHA